MSEKAIAKLFKHGRSQAVRLPKEFRLPGQEVKISHLGHGVFIEPLKPDVDALFAALDRYGDIPFMEGGREQPSMPEDEPLFE